MIRLGSEIGWPAQRDCNTAHLQSCRDCKHRRGRGTAVIQRKYRYSEVNESIVIATIARNVPRWFTSKRMFSQKPKLIRSVTSDGLTNIYKQRVSLNIIQKSANKFGRKIGFNIENGSEDQNQPSPKLNRDLNSTKMHFRSKFGDSTLNGWWVMVRKSSKWGKIRISNYIWPWRSRSINPKNNRNLNQGDLHLWSKFGNPSLNERWVIVRTSSWLIHTHGHTDPQTQAMTIPEGQSWPRVKSKYVVK